MSATLRRRAFLGGLAALSSAPVAAQLAPKPIPNADLDRLAAFRRMIASDDGAPVLWWFAGLFVAHVDGVREITALRVESVRVCEVRQETSNALVLAWREIGLFRDLVSGEVVGDWTNPFTLQRSIAPAPFDAGSGDIALQRAADTVTIASRHRTTDTASAALAFEGQDGRVILTLTDASSQGFPGLDGSLAEITAPGKARVTSVMSIVADRAALVGKNEGFLPCAGLRTQTFDAIPDWAGYPGRLGFSVVRGALRKSRHDQRLNLVTWQALRAARPQDFDGDALVLS